MYPCILRHSPVVANASLSTTGSSHGDVATVTCHPGFVITPRDVSNNMTCLETSTWSSFDGTCLQVEFFNGSSFMVPPWPVGEGWSACMKGVYEGGGDMLVNLLPDGDLEPSDDFSSFLNITLRVAFRDFKALDLVNRTVNCAYKENGQTVRFDRDVGRMPLKANDPFTLLLTVLNHTLHSTVNGVHFSCGHLPPAVNLSAARYLAVWASIKSMDYVHTTSGHACL